MATANDIRRGMAINYNGDVAVVLDAQHRTPGNLRAFVQASIRSIKTGKSSDVRFSSTEKIEVVPLQMRRMDYSYKDGQDYVFSDPETYETVTVAPEIIGDGKNYMTENCPVAVTFVEDKVVSVEVPPSVVLTVKEAPEGIRGDSANNVQKAVIMETGITVQAPSSLRPARRSRLILAPANTWNGPTVKIAGWTEGCWVKARSYPNHANFQEIRQKLPKICWV
jgi:elongation factor P